MRLNNFFSKYWGLFVILILSFWSIRFFFLPGFFPMHDDTQVSRIFEMGKALKEGMFPVRWSSDLGYGYGYPIFNFYAPLSYYFGGFLMILGIDALISTKVTMMTGILMSGVFMYFLARNFWKEEGGIIAGLLYVYATYHAVDIFVRGDMAEFWAYGFIPLLFWGFYKVYEKTSSDNTSVLKWIIVGSLGYAGVILSHNLAAFMVTLFLILFVLILLLFTKYKKLTAFYFFSSAVLGLLLSAFYWLPVPIEIKYTNVFSQVGGSADFRNHFVCLSQFWYSPWGFGGSAPGCADGLSFALGKLYIFLPLLSIAGIFIFWKRKKTQAIALIVAFLGLILSLFLTTEFSKTIWEIIQLMAFLQYPWRFLVFAAFFSSILSGSVIFIIGSLIKNKIVVWGITVFIIAMLLFSQAKFFVPQKILSVSSGYYTDQNVLRWKISKISDEYMPKNFSKPKSEKELAQNTFVFSPTEGEFIATNEKTQQKDAKISVSTGKSLVLNLAYFPAWHYYVDNVSEPVQNISGRISAFLPKGTHTLSLIYMQTPIEILGNMLSLAGLLCVFIGIIYCIKLYEKEKS